MSRSIHFISKSISGYGTPDGRCLPCSGVSGRAVGVTPNSSRGDYTLISDVKFLSLRCASKHMSSVCNASSSNYRRNSDFSRQNRHGFSRNRNRHNEERDGYEDLEESETLTSKNGPVLSFAGNQKFQATATPGPREKEIVELFRKVQAQLRERAAMKEEKKVEDSQQKSKESETVDSLLKLLRKHSVQQGKKNTNSASNRDFILDQPEQVEPSTEGSVTSIADSNITVKHEMQESPSPNLGRPRSNFRKRSPVPEIKFQPVYSDGSFNSVSENKLDDTRKAIIEPEANDLHELKIESDAEPLLSERNVFDEVSEDDTSEIYASEHDDEEDEHNLVEASDLSGMKLTELRALAKSRGVKGFSKLKKKDLVELLSGSSI
ncbi:Rho-N domain-containing protein 1, chloroplastic [Sesamum alatum]|uniref:Rho-N domain-containing protein 1, chloroplastic n=1 Tax=Sesamum alatum TaxID=300844 RepID=A0AAE1Z527_9LAMI|nr:Rho-N domain-containing protein 1, chloroplastic [Sesamum alatum]